MYIFGSQFTAVIDHVCMHVLSEKKCKSCFGSTFACVFFLLLAEFGSLSTLTRVAILHTAEFDRVVKCAILSTPIGREGCYVLSDWFEMPPLQNLTIWRNSSLRRMAPLFLFFILFHTRQIYYATAFLCSFFLFTATFILI